ncbi:acylpyruvase FAHD1, mitochondrial [Aplysia californica]|uniref:oxaloacetate tautomerase n=1 Tax=Aplysia californica TaxID=6500 RepID=A0ABM0K1K8_APLCA|nr:acylpyruvase FAHD1, mitochondrial [Aplysia californica]
MSKLANFREIGRKIVCVGRNYSEHAAELNNPVPTKPILFLKPTSSYVAEGSPIKIPKDCTDLNHEVELGIVIGSRASCISVEEASQAIGGYALGLDMTARDWQNEAKKKGHPWSIAKGFDTSCPISAFVEKDKIKNPNELDIWLTVNGEKRQSGNTRDMIFSVEYLISYISQFFTLEPGDLLLTGTPSGVSRVQPGDVLKAGLGDVVSMQFKVEA